MSYYNFSHRCTVKTEKAFEHGAIVRRGCRGWEVLGWGRAGGVKPVSSRLIAARRFHNNFNTPGGSPRISGAYFYKRFWFPEEPGCHPRVHAFNLHVGELPLNTPAGFFLLFFWHLLPRFWYVYVVCIVRFNLLNRCSLLDFSCDNFITVIFIESRGYF